MTPEVVEYILNNGGNEDIDRLTPDDCLTYLARCLDEPVDNLRKRFRNIKEELPINDQIIKKYVDCPICEGNDQEKCQTCNGTGKVRKGLPID